MGSKVSIEKIQESARKCLLEAAQAEINVLVAQLAADKLCREELKTGVRDVIKYMDAIPIHQDGPPPDGSPPPSPAPQRK
jgi:hypothetical protein